MIKLTHEWADLQPETGRLLLANVRRLDYIFRKDPVYRELAVFVAAARWREVSEFYKGVPEVLERLKLGTCMFLRETAWPGVNAYRVSGDHLVLATIDHDPPAVVAAVRIIDLVLGTIVEDTVKHDLYWRAEGYKPIEPAAAEAHHGA